MSVKFIGSTRFFAILALVVIAFTAGWLFNQYIIPGFDRPLIGTCENTDVGVTTDTPKQYMMTSSGMEERTISATNLATISMAIVDSFDYSTTRIIVQKLNDRCCNDYLQIVQRSDSRVNIRTFSVSDAQYIVRLQNGFWKIYRPVSPATGTM